MNTEILKFIQRFPINENDVDQWMGHNDYYFAHILKTRFRGEIWFDMINCHFLFRYFDNFFDWTGLRAEYDLNKPETVDNLIKWTEMKKFDEARYRRIWRDVIE